jgi:uridylate kinase
MIQMPSKKAKYKRVLLKVSGEILAGKESFGISLPAVSQVAQEIESARKLDLELALVVGGGNIFRGQAGSRRAVDRVTGDYMEMLATVINALGLQSELERRDIVTRVQTAINIDRVAEPYIRRRTVRHLEKGRVVILAGGTGNPYFSTDTAACLRAIEIGAEIVLKGTRVEGVYDRDPLKDPRARMFSSVSYFEVLKRGLGVMDATAVSLCREHQLPIVVFDLRKPGNLRKILTGGRVGTFVGTINRARRSRQSW